MSIGISTSCFYPLVTEQALAELLKNNVKTTEIFFNSRCELEPAFIGGLVELLSQTGGKVTAIHPFTSGYEPYLLFSRYERRFSDGLELYRRYFEAAAALNAKYVILHGDKALSEIEDSMFFERVNTLCEASKPFGVQVLQENVNKFRGETPAFLRSYRHALGDNAEFVFDVKQAVRAGYDPFEILDAMGKKIRHVHLSDHSGKNDCLLPGQGEFDFRRLFGRLKAFDYSGDLVLEVYREAFSKTEEILQSADMLRHLTDLS
ncbi:MAG: sugar phosphate isomerase/epimerase [Oscillospiraceae bacterium]|jgi:sugar phosphate isomerase/epimerase|nr:sugar phosphate isomerase/epimerase [Oscillospiraceae bacterium]